MNDQPNNAKESSTLLDCPFCGEQESLFPEILPTTAGEPWKCIYCRSCGAQGPMSKNGLEANRLWNKRKSNAKNEGLDAPERNA
jgi:Lar family restriction alleviation protein